HAVPGSFAGRQSARIRILDGSSHDLGAVGVSLIVNTSPPRVVAAPQILRFRASLARPGDFEQAVFLRNTAGGGQVQFSAASVNASPWITHISTTGVVSPDGPALVRVAVNTSGLRAGTLRDVIR